MTVYLSELAFVDAHSRGTLANTMIWNEDGTRTVPDIATFFPNNPGVSRTDTASRFLLAAGSLLPAIPPELLDDVAVVIGTNFGSLDADRRWVESLAQRPQPRIYARTLSSIPPAELSIFLQTRGPVLTLSGSVSVGFSALATACDLLALGHAKMAVAGMYEYAPLDGVKPLAIVALISTTPFSNGAVPIDVVVFSGFSDESKDLFDLYRALLGGQDFQLMGSSQGSYIEVRTAHDQQGPDTTMTVSDTPSAKRGPS